MTASAKVKESAKGDTHVTILGSKICVSCIDWWRWQGPLGCCENAQSNHYGHMVQANHPACEYYCKSRIQED